MTHTNDETPVVTTPNRARAAVTGHNVRYVLLISILGVVVAFGAMWLFYFH